MGPNMSHKFSVVAGISLLALSACGGGGSGGGRSPAPGGAAPLASKQDVLRELQLSMFPLLELLDEGELDLGGAAARAARSGGNRPKDGTPCANGEGSYTYQENRALHRFDFFRQELPDEVPADFMRETFVVCLDAFQGSRTITDGVREAGNDGDQFSYFRAGANGRDFEERHEEREAGQLVFDSTLNLLGDRESQFGNAGLDQRAVYSYRYEDSDGTEIAVDLGEPGKPFRAVSGGFNLSLNGTYAYRTDRCDGGKVKVTTLEALTVDQLRHPSDGRIRFDSGSKTATLEFDENGGAQLNLNGVSQPVTADEIAEVLEDGSC